MKTETDEISENYIFLNLNIKTEAVNNSQEKLPDLE
jgi:hypothetical protein